MSIEVVFYGLNFIIFLLCSVANVGTVLAKSSVVFDTEYDLANEKPLMIGFGALDYFTGTMDEIRIYNKSLSSNEVETLFNQG